MEVIARDTTDIRAQATVLVELIELDGTAEVVGTAVHIGAGVYLTAAHSVYDSNHPTCLKRADDFRFTVGAGLDSETSFLINAQSGGPPSQCTFTTGGTNTAAFPTFGWGTDGAPDIAVILGPDVGAPAVGLWASTDPDAIQTPVTNVGFPLDGGLEERTMIASGGSIEEFAYAFVQTGDDIASVVVSQPGLRFRQGQDGSGVFGGAPTDAQAAIDPLLLGIASLGIGNSGSAMGIEPVGEVYMAVTALLENLGLDADDLPDARVDLGQEERIFQGSGTSTDEPQEDPTFGDPPEQPPFVDPPDPFSGDPDNIPLSGTFLNETIIADRRGSTIDAGDGDDRIIGDLGDDRLDGGAGRDVILAGSGSDRLIDGDGVDLLFGGHEIDPGVFNGAATETSASRDTFVLVADGRPDDIRDFNPDCDRIDISAWGTTAFDQLEIRDHRSGRVYLEFGGERLLIDDGGRSLDAADMAEHHFVFEGTFDGGNTVTGTNEGEKIFGSILDDTIVDLGGIDAMFGRSGADRFLLTEDGELDYIKDFQDGVDQIVIAHPGVTSFDHVAVHDLGNGKVLLEMATGPLIVMNPSRSLTPDDFSAADFEFPPIFI